MFLNIIGKFLLNDGVKEILKDFIKKEFPLLGDDYTNPVNVKRKIYVELDDMLVDAKLKSQQIIAQGKQWTQAESDAFWEEQRNKLAEKMMETRS